MADGVEIEDLSIASSIADSDAFLIQQSGTTRQIDFETMRKDAVDKGIVEKELVNSTQLQTAVAAVSDEVDAVKAQIPAQASSSNQLADKEFVNSSIATNTSNFCGTFNSVAELEAYSGAKTNNDYAFVVTTDAAGNTKYNRYKYVEGTTPSWVFEYTLNNSSFTAEQWAAIQSGITAELVARFMSGIIPANIFDMCHPVGEKYIQLGGEPYPWELYTITTRAQWQNISSQYANEYFRVAGGEKPMGYFLTEDTEIVAGKTYYTRSGTDPNYTYTAVASPVVENIGTYYELSSNLTASTINNGDSDYLHITQNEGIPNITGTLGIMQNGVYRGAFQRGPYQNNWSNGDKNSHYNVYFNATDGETKIDGTLKNDVYGKSDHVTTYNSAIQIWRRIG